MALNKWTRLGDRAGYILSAIAGFPLVGFRGIPINPQTGDYTTVEADAGYEIQHPSGAGAGHTFTIASNAAVPYEVGTGLSFANLDSNDLSIAIASDTLIFASDGSTGTRTLAENGMATAIKQTATVWLVSGTGLT